MTGPALLDFSTNAALVLLTLALLLGIVRLVRGPTLADRILALDLMTTLAVGYIATFAIRTGFSLYIDIAIAISLVGFLATVAFARYLLARASQADREQAEEAAQ